MESNSDKQLRDKLTGVEFRFDPQAWEQMEDMLDKKKKRRGFFWWWTGGIAAALLFAIVGYELGISSGKLQVAGNKLNIEVLEVENQKSAAKESAAVSSSREQVNKEGKNQNPKGNTRAAVGSGSERENENGISEKLKGNAIAAVSSSEHANVMSKEQVVKSKREKPNSKEVNEGNTAALIPVNSSETLNPSANVLSKKQKRKQQLLAKANEGGVNTTVSRFEKNPLQERTDLLAASTTKDLLAKRIEMDGRAGFLKSSSDESSFSKISEEALPKAKKKIFNYSLGVVANVTGTILDNPDSLRGFYNKPSYAVGFTHEFLFLKRVAITNSILYSQTGFKVYHPVAPADTSSTTSGYSAAISELQIPIGIKAYPVNKKWFRLSIAAGIINHIKLKEFFTVEKQTYQYQITPPITNFDNTVTTGNNPFVEGLNKSSNLSDHARTQGEQGEYFGMGGLRRYYASFYASAGVEFIAKRKYIFFTEPMFYMTLNKIGLQEKRKYNVGVSGGFRYQF